MLLVLAMALASQAGVVTRPVANMYSGPTRQADVVSQAIHGAAIALLEAQPGWAKVRTPDDYIGWMESSSLRKLAEGDKPYASAGRTASIDSLFANLYAEPDATKHEPLLTLPFEARLEISAERDARWLQARLADGRSAWVERGNLAFDLTPVPAASLVEISRRFLGLPYLWGGTSTFGYDCSGFMQMLLRRRGVLLPRDAQPQAGFRGLITVERGDLKPGDLLYFGAEPRKITHTGMYLGGGEFISATTHLRPVVQVSKLDEPYWAKLFVAARRLR